MESPERSEGTHATPVDPGSPFFKYLCGLSPIKPAKSMHVVQTYAELTLPPPPTVFTSPPVNPRKSCGGSRSRRGMVVSRTASAHVTVEVVGNAWGNNNTWGGDGGGGDGEGGCDEKENQLKNQFYMRKSYVDASTAQQHPNKSSSLPSSEYNSRQQQQQQQHFLHRQVELQQHEQAAADLQVSADDTPTNFEYGDVCDYLADPAEGGLYAAAPSSSQVVAREEAHRSSPSPREEEEEEDEEDGGYHNEGGEEILSAEQQDRAGCCGDANAIQRGSSGSGSDHEGSGSSTGAEKASHLDEETARMAFLLVGDADGDGGKNRCGWAASHLDLSEFNRRNNSDISGAESVPSFSQLKTRDDFELAASKALENQRNAEADARERKAEARKGVVVDGGTSNQRGVRRRCLDFEASVRRKSMGNGTSRKRSGPRSEAPPGSSSAMTSASSLPTSALCERAVATSDATTSAASDSHSDVSLRHECITSGIRVPSPGLLRISRSIVQNNAELLSSDQCSIDPARLGRDGKNSSSSMGIPSGIGLHLNSLTGRISFSPTNRELKQGMGITPIAKGAVASLLAMPGLAGAETEIRSEEYGNGALGVGAGSSNLSMGFSSPTAGTGVVMLMERSRMALLESLPVVDMSQDAMQTNTMQSLADGGGGHSLEASQPSSANGLEKQLACGEKKRPLHQDVLQQSNAEEFDSPRSQQKRRKSSTGSGDKSGDGCKRCTCKKSKCLKLYCECFAAGTYCMGSCTCRDCFNKPEHEETVMSTRRQIESRNPLAFAPKIVHSGDGSSPKLGEETIEIPASSHHKRGCNCKKSLCLKKYCECYQAGVGCSEGCRCEGCKNMYGRKEAVEDSDETETAPNALESGSMEDELELARPGFHGGVGDMDPYCNNGKELSPITPSFQYTGQGRAVERVRSAGKKRSSSPLSLLQPVAKPPRSPAFSTRSSVKLQSNNSLQRTPQLQHLRGVNSPTSTPKLSRVNQQLSPRWDGLGDICTLTPLPQPPLRPTPASISTLHRTGASPSFSYQSIEPINSYQPDKLDSVSKSSPPPFQQASDHSPLSSCGLLNLRKASSHSALCPAALPSSSSYLGSNNAKAEDTRSADLSFMCDDDDTPDFLKYTDSTNSPAITKSGSPNQKRVSPPHFEGMRDRSRDGGVVFDSPARSSSGLRRGRKFILQALP